MPTFDHPHFSGRDMVIQAALREDARNNRAPRYRQTPVTGIASRRVTVQEKVEQNVARQIIAGRTWFEAVMRRNEMIAGMARLNLNGIDTGAIEVANTLVANAETQLATVNGILLDAHTDLDMEDFEDLRAAMHARFDSLTAPSLDDPNAEHRQGPEDCLNRRTA